MLAAGVILYALFALLCGVAASFELLIAGRVAMGASAAVTRVLVVSMIRDLFEGESMARIMSLVFMTFMIVPVLAPLVGQGVLLLFPWRGIFIVLALYAAAMLAWAWIRLPETLHPEYRRSLEWRPMGERDVGDAQGTPIARLHAGADRQLRRADRLYFADSAAGLRGLRLSPR